MDKNGHTCNFVAIPRVCVFDLVWKGTIVNSVEGSCLAVCTGIPSACVSSFSLESFRFLVASVEGERTRRPFASLALRRKIMTCVEAPTVVGFEKTLSLLPILRGARSSVASRENRGVPSYHDVQSPGGSSLAAKRPGVNDWRLPHLGCALGRQTPSLNCTD